MKLDMLPLLSGARQTEPIAYKQDAAKLLLAGDNFVFSDVTFSQPLRVGGEVINTAGDMRLHLEVTVSYDTQCARCLCPLRLEKTFTVDKPIGQTAGAMALVNDEDADDYVLIENGCIDLDVPVREQIEADFPMRHLCREDCAGLCPQCGKNKNEGQCDCNLHRQDPRLQKLADLLKQNETK